MADVLIRSTKGIEFSDLVATTLSECKARGWFGGLPSRVVIKPNLCDIVSHDNGVTTDPAVVCLIARFIRNTFPGTRVTVVESDATSAYSLYRSLRETYDRLGYSEMASAENIEMLNLTEEPSHEIMLPELPFPIAVPEIFFENLFFISIANMKVHPYERFTGTLKNAIGLIPEADKSRYHPYLPEVIHALYNIARPDLAIIDARRGLQGMGPIIGTPVETNLFIVSPDALAVDVTAARIMGISPESSPHLRHVLRQTGRRSAAIAFPPGTPTFKFEFESESLVRLIRMKAGVSRFSRRLERVFQSTATRLHSFRTDPLGFLQRACRRLGRLIVPHRE